MTIFAGAKGQKVNANIATEQEIEAAHAGLESETVELRATVKLLNDLNLSSVSSAQKSLLLDISKKVGLRQALTDEEGAQYEELRVLITNAQSDLENSNIKSDILVANIIEGLNSVVTDVNLSRELRSSALSEAVKLTNHFDRKLEDLDLKDTVKVQAVLATSVENLKKSGKTIDFKDLNKYSDLSVRTSDERKQLDDSKVGSKTFKDAFRENPSQFSQGARKGVISTGLHATGLGDLDEVFGITDKLDSILGVGLSKLFKKRDKSSEDPLSVINENTKLTADSSEKTAENISVLTSLTKDQLNLLNDGQSKVISGQETIKNIAESEASKRSDGVLDTFKKSKEKSSEKSSSFLGDLFDQFAGNKIKGKLAGLKSGILGKAVGLATGAAGIAGSTIGTASGIASSVGAASKFGLGGAAKLAGKAAKFIPGLGQAVMAGQALYDGFQGYDAEKGQKLYGDSSWKGKTASAATSIASGLTFGLVSEEDIAGAAKWVVSGIKDTFSEVVDAISGSINWITNGIKKAFTFITESLGKTADYLIKPYKETFEFFSNAIQSPIESMSGMLASIGNGFTGLFDWLCDLPVIGKFFQGLKVGGQAVINLGSNIATGVGQAYTVGKERVSQAATAVQEGASKAWSAVKGAITGVKETGKGYNVVEGADGSVIKQEGARNWRNNNPGNIEAGDYANKMGAIGSDGRFAIFPSQEAGRGAKEKLIFEGKNYKDLNVDQAIKRYAPPSENNTDSYVKNVLESVGGANKKMSEYTPEERQKIMDRMAKVEGYREGKTTILKEGTSKVSVASNSSLNSGQSSLSAANDNLIGGANNDILTRKLVFNDKSVTNPTPSSSQLHTSSDLNQAAVNQINRSKDLSDKFNQKLSPTELNSLMPSNDNQQKLSPEVITTGSRRQSAKNFEASLNDSSKLVVDDSKVSRRQAAKNFEASLNDSSKPVIKSSGMSLDEILNTKVAEPSSVSRSQAAKNFEASLSNSDKNSGSSLGNVIPINQTPYKPSNLSSSPTVSPVINNAPVQDSPLLSVESSSSPATSNSVSGGSSGGGSSTKATDKGIDKRPVIDDFGIHFFNQLLLG